MDSNVPHVSFVSTIGTPTDYYYYYDNSTFDYDYGDEPCDHADANRLGSLLSLVFFSIVVVFSLFGNIGIMVILVKYESLKSFINALILNLAVSDLIVTSGLPFWASYYYQQEWTLGEFICKTLRAVFDTGFYSNGILLIVMTIHRYIAVMSPQSQCVYIKGFHTIAISALIWICSAAAAIPAFLYSKVHENNSCEASNSFWSLWGVYQHNILFVLINLVFIFCYAQIIYRLLHSTSQKRKQRTLKVIFMLMLVFFVTWIPYNIVIFLRSLSTLHPTTADSATLNHHCETYSSPLEYALYISRIVTFSQCCLNPIFYVFVGVKFKNHLRRMLKSWGQKQNSTIVRNRNSRLTITSITSGEECPF